MARKIKLNHDQILSMVSSIRKHNNVLWMEIMRIALKKSPRRTKAVLKAITQNDRDISEWLSRV
jgi:hypothetical protein